MKKAATAPLTTKPIAPTFRDAIAAVRSAWRMTQAEFGALFGVSARTVLRWELGDRRPKTQELPFLVGKVHGADPAKAASIAASLGTTLEALGLARSTQGVAAPGVVATREAIDAALCAAAEQADVSPRALRPALVTLLRRFAELGIGPADAATLLSKR